MTPPGVYVFTRSKDDPASVFVGPYWNNVGGSDLMPEPIRIADVINLSSTLATLSSGVAENKQALSDKAPANHNHSWAQITNKPSEFTPASHTHAVTDVSGLQDALDEKADNQALADVAATVPSTADIETIALENALVNEEQPIVKAELVDGVLVLTRRDGVELTVEGSMSLAPSSVVWRLPWPSLLGSTSGGWLSREGNMVTLRIQNPSVRNGSSLMNVPVGFQPFMSREQRSMLDAYAVTAERTVIGGAAAFWGTTLQASIPEALRNMVDTGQVNAETGAPIMQEQSQTWRSLTVRWVTLDPMPEPAQTEDIDPNAPLQLVP